MNYTFLSHIKANLPQHTWPWVIAALRHDNLVWDTLQNSSINLNISTDIRDPEKWNPALVAFMLMGQPVPLSNTTISLGLRQRAFRSYETIKQNYLNSSLDLHPMLQSALLAIALNERFKLSGKWEHLIGDLTSLPIKVWRTPLACLYGLAEKPLDILRTLFMSGLSSGIYELGIHMLFCNPLPSDIQITQLCTLVESLPLPDKNTIIQIVSVSRPTIGVALAKRLNIEPQAKEQYHLLDSLVYHYHLAEISIMKQENEMAVVSLANAQETARLIQARLAAQSAQANGSQLDSWHQAFGLAPEEPYYRASLAMKYLDENNITEAGAILDPSIATNHPLLLFAFANFAKHIGNLEKAREYALQAVKFTEALGETHSSRQLQRDSFSLQLAKFLLALKLPLAAIRAALVACEEKPDNPSALSYLGEAYEAASQPTLAAESFQWAVLLDPDNLDLRRKLAKSLELVGNWSKAIDERKLLSGELRSNVNDQHALADCAIHNSQPEYALEICNIVLNKFPNDAVAYTLQGEAWDAIGDFDKSQECYTRATEIDPNLLRPWVSMANSQKKVGQHQKALDILRIASQAIPGSAEIHLALGLEYSSTGSFTQALSCFQKAAEIDPGNMVIELNLGKTLKQLGHTQQAYIILKQSYKNDPSNIEIAEIYADILLKQEDPLSALPALETVIYSNPNNPEPFVNYARALLLTLGDPCKATQSLQRALELEPGHNEAQALLGEVLAVEGKYNEALHAYQKAIETPLTRNPEWHTRLNYGIGNVALQLGKYEMAITSLLEATQSDPQNYKPHCLLADAYLKLGLKPDSYHSACEALRLSDEDFNGMIWFVEKSFELIGDDQILIEIAGEGSLHSDEIQQHAIQILNRAAEIVPERADDLIKLAEVQTKTGNKSGALTSYKKITTIETATSRELQKSAVGLRLLSDVNGAVVGLEKALAKIEDIDGSKEIYNSILTQLADAYQQINLPGKALEVIEKVIQQNTTDVTLYIKKAQILREVQDSHIALEYLTETIKHLPHQRLYYCIATMYFEDGKLPEAFKVAEAGISNNTTDFISEEIDYIHLVILATEIALTLLQHELARCIINTHLSRISRSTSTSTYIYYALCSEISLNGGDEIEAANFLNKALEKGDENSPVILALQARFATRRGDITTALNTFNRAMQRYGDKVSNDLTMTEQKYLSNSILRHEFNEKFWFVTNPLLNAALELNQWGCALRLAQNYVNLAPKAPLAYWNLIRVLVLRAEFQYLCQDVDLIQHAPGPVALSEGTCRAYEQAAQSCFSEYQAYSESSNIPSEQLLIEKWTIRGRAIFSPSEQSVLTLNEWASQKMNPDDIAASIAARRHILSINEIPQPYMNHTASSVLTQTAISQSKQYPVEAIKTIQLAILNEPVSTINLAIRNYLLARVSKKVNSSTALSAIQNALSIIPDEPRWCALAANITLDQGDKNTAISHFENAIQIEPRNTSHYLALGNIYLKSAEQGTRDDILMAIKYFEQVCRLDPHHSDGWLELARAYRFSDNIEQAESAAKQAANLSPENAATYMILAEIALHTGKFQQAHDYAKVSNEKNPNSTETAILLSRALQALGRPADALTVIDQTIPESKQSLPISMERIKLIKKSQGPESALQAMKRLAEINPEDPDVLAMLAEGLADVGQDDLAIRTAQKALLLGESLGIESQANLRLILGRVLRRAGQLDQAMHHLNEAIRLTPHKIEPLIELGRTHQDRRQQAQALLMYRQAANIAPLDPRPYLQAGLALKEGKDYIESESMLRRASELAPNDITIRRQLAAVLAINLVHNPHQKLNTESL